MSQFHHRANHNSIVVGDYLYIDGGEIGTWNGTGKGYLSTGAWELTDSNVTTSPDYKTYSIDLSSSWTNKTVVLNSINKKAPAFNNEALWLDATENSFYAYDGAYSYTVQIITLPAPTNQLWKFTPAGNSGSWSLVQPPPSSNFSTLSRSTHGAYAFGNGLGFALGGQEYAGTDSAWGAGSMDIPGLVIYDTNSQEWFNVSSTGYSWSGTSVSGAADFVPSFGPKGLLFVLGGAANSDTALVPFDTVSMYDHATQVWRTQKVTGDLPHLSSQSCVVGMPGDNGTYEIFLYGGLAYGDQGEYSTAATVSQGGVYVLTLPAFHWLKQASTPTGGRYSHSCNVVGNRQMAVVGGVPVTMDSTLDYIPPDPWPKGIGIFDMSAMEWTDGYDANAATYITPDVVKAYYQNNGRYPSSWSSDEVKEWFEIDAQNSTTSSETDDNSNTSSTSTGAIAGGVVAGVVVLLAIGLVIWYLRRRKQRARNKAEVSDKALLEQEREQLQVDNAPRAKKDHFARYELPAKDRPTEAGGTAVYEMPNDSSK